MRFLEPLMAISFVLLASASPLANLTKRSPPEQADPGHRRGIAYNDPNLVKYFDVKDAQLGWCYNWYSQPGNNNWAHEYVPMLWSNSQSLIGNWNDAVSQAVNIYPDKPTHLMAFNEPDNCANGAGGSCMSVPDAVTAWKQHMEPTKNMKDLMYLGSPAVTNGGPGMGLDWLADFLKQCDGCSIDFICVHWYDNANNAQYFKDHLNKVRDLAKGRPIWITEMGAVGTDDEIKGFLNEVIPWMDDSGDIHRYAYFMAREGLLINSQGNDMSEIGRHFTYWRREGSGFTAEPSKKREIEGGGQFESKGLVMRAVKAMAAMMYGN